MNLQIRRPAIKILFLTFFLFFYGTSYAQDKDDISTNESEDSLSELTEPQEDLKNSNSTQHSFQRDSWYIGFGIGAPVGGSLTRSSDGKNITFKELTEGYQTQESTFINMIKWGMTINPKTLVGFDWTTGGQEGETVMRDSNGFTKTTSASVSVQNFFLMGTYFPNEHGLFFRGGGGFSLLSLKSKENDTTTERHSVGGPGLLAGIGYAFWLGESFNITINFDYSRQFYTGDDLIRGSDFSAIWVGFDWY